MIAPATEARCARCKVTKPVEAFNWANRAQGERQAVCRPCFSEYNRKRYEQQSESIKSRVRAYAAANVEKIKARNHARYWRDVEASRARARISAAIQNPKRRAKKREWARRDRAANPEKWRAKNRAWVASNPEAAFARDNRRRARKLAATIMPVTGPLLRQKWNYWGGRCWMCAAPAVEWDHVKPLSVGGYHCLANLRPACRSCNASKGNAWPWPRKES